MIKELNISGIKSKKSELNERESIKKKMVQRYFSTLFSSFFFLAYL